VSILFSGDFHANVANELKSITRNAILKNYGQEMYSRIKYHIILGDGGFMWPGNHKGDLQNYKSLGCRPFPILCVAGNHEPFYGMKDKLPETDIGIGETVYQINSAPFVAYLKRGKAYTIDGIKFLVLGGALSIDKNIREPNESWWELEYWTEREKRDVFKLLETENDFDYVISHTGPQHINKKLFGHIFSNMGKFVDEVAFLNDEIYGRIRFIEWWCGHWHRDEYYFDKRAERGYRYLYRKTKILELTGDVFSVYDECGQ